MKISNIVIALSLIGPPLPALAVCVQGDIPEVCAGRMEREAQQDRWDAENAAIERKEKADKHAKALSISDETVMNFPIKDVNAACRVDKDQRVVNACLDPIQHYYTIGKILWNQASLDERKICLSIAAPYTHPVHFYGSLESCLQNKKQEADMLRPRTFNAW